jgi:hypothetical protein
MIIRSKLEYIFNIINLIFLIIFLSINIDLINHNLKNFNIL